MVGTPQANNVCRRCKKKRPDDEPMETARYRTCKPCREIERKLKRIKKAQITGTPIEDIDTEDLQRKKAREIEQNIIQMARQVTNSLPSSDLQGLAEAVNVGMDMQNLHHNQQFSAAVNAAVAAMQHTSQGPPQIHQYDQSRENVNSSQHQPMMPVQGTIDDQKEIPIDESLLKQGTDDAETASNTHGSSGIGDEASLKKSPILKSEVSPSAAVHTGEPSDSKQINAQHSNNNIIDNNNNNNQHTEGDLNTEGQGTMNNQGGSKGVTPEGIQYCLYCGVERSIDDNGRYNLCGNCVNDPLEKANVFDDFGAYLERIEHGQEQDIRNAIFIKKMGDEIPDFVQNSEENNLADVVTALNVNFVYRIMDKSGFRFSKSSSNFSAKPFPKSIKMLYKCKQDVKTIQKNAMQGGEHPITTPGGNNSNMNNRRLKTEDCNSSFYVSYDILNKGLSIKYNHLTHTPYLNKLYTATVLERVRAIAEKVENIKEGYSLWKLLTDNEENSDLKNEMSTVKEMVFMKDFGPLFKNYTY